MENLVGAMKQAETDIVKHIKNPETNNLTNVSSQFRLMVDNEMDDISAFNKTQPKE